MDDLIGDDVGPGKPRGGGPPVFTRTHAGITAALLAVAVAFSVWVGFHDPVDRNAVYVVAGFAGPFAGSIARDNQTCCLGFSWQLALKVCGPALGLAVALQFVPTLRRTRSGRAGRMLAWTMGWLVWCLGVPASYLHALG